MTEDEMVGWHHRLDGHESGQTLRLSVGQGSPVCYTVHVVAKSRHDLATEPMFQGIPPLNVLLGFQSP